MSQKIPTHLLAILPLIAMLSVITTFIPETNGNISMASSVLGF
jgi:hypothetical protein